MEFRISKKEIIAYNNVKAEDFPKYTTQLINLANQNAKGTRPNVVGQMSELFPEYNKQTDDVSLTGWEDWYMEQHPGSIENATDKIYGQIENIKKAIQLIDRDMIVAWVKDLIITKTYNGLYVQKAILSEIAKRKQSELRFATPAEESKGIDGFIGGTAYSVKPDTYKTMDRLSEQIKCKMIYYTKTETGFKIEVED